MKAFLLLACLFVSIARAEDFSGKSPSGKLSFESKNGKEFYVWITDKPEKKVLVYKEEAVFIQSAAISPDDVWIGLEHGGSSLGHTVLFFKRQKGLDFKQFGGGNNDPDPADKAGALALQSQGIKENILDHSYLKPIKWSNDSMWLRVALGAKGKYQGKVVEVTDWQCRYNPVSHDIRPVKDNPGKVEIAAPQ